jgi:nitrogenase molybdenum-cofactor synthesis protein NifE
MVNKPNITELLEQRFDTLSQSGKSVCNAPKPRATTHRCAIEKAQILLFPYADGAYPGHGPRT